MHAVIFIGIQGSGKTTFYRQRFFETHVRISMDMLRTRHREGILLAACLTAKQPFVIDNTNVLAAERALYIPVAKRAGFRVTGYFFRTPLRAAIARNAKRQDKKAIPVAGVVGKYKRLQTPAPEEGFDEVLAVELTAQDQFLVTAYVPEEGGG
ncbi:MAG TPA: ATP-binding protein [Bryobacteraceae bacterium]|nr:ATP-binding protein [Bryobacteraceae bacterium]